MIRDQIKKLPALVSSSLTILLSLAATQVAAYYSDKQGIVSLHKDIMTQIAGATISFFLGLLAYCFLLSYQLREDVRSSRKIKLAYWKEELSKYNSFADLHGTPIYNELCEYIPKEEMASLAKNNGTVIEVIANHACASDASKMIVDRLHKVITDKEKEWVLKIK